MSDTDRSGRQFIVHGRVQGVGFRWFVQRTATELELAGWVRNEPDGTVQAEAHGASVDLLEFSRRLSSGPPAAKVESVESREPSVSTTEGAFRILR